MRNARAVISRIKWFGLGIVILVAVTAMPTRGSLSVRQSGVPDSQRIEEVLNDYLYGVRDGDIERLRRAFYPTAEVEGIRNGVLTSWSVQQYLSAFRPSRRQRFVPRILAVDQIGSAAVGKVEEDHGTWRFVDYMQLLKIDGEWKIVNKIYERVVEAAPSQ